MYNLHTYPNVELLMPVGKNRFSPAYAYKDLALVYVLQASGLKTFSDHASRPHENFKYNYVIFTK